jgi:predicted hotdog family 3-hydroxylacyl-ACP dehydratase
MLDRAAILTMIPHQGAMCLLDGVRSWSASHIACFAHSHLDPANPLRRDGRLSSICGCEYGLQAAAVHGALLAGGRPGAAGYVAALQITRAAADRLDHPASGSTMTVEADLELADAGGLIYRFALRAEDGGLLLEGRGTVVLPGRARDQAA